MAWMMYFIFHFFIFGLTTAALECPIASKPAMRIFNSITQYQGNTISFNPLRPQWRGSYVAFNFDTINKLPRNIFYTFDSKYIIQLDLSGKHIEDIDGGAFSSLECLHTLQLSHNNITKLEKDTFQGLKNLQELHLSANSLSHIPDLVFWQLHQLKILNLSWNKIHTIASAGFYNLTQLLELNLEGNNLCIIPMDLFKPLINLKTLNLAENRIMSIESEKWEGLTQLEHLNLARNHLISFDPDYDFPFTKLKSLNLSSNSLSEFNALALRQHFSELGVIDINNNAWICDDLTTIVHDLTDSKITIFGANSTMPTNDKQHHGIGCMQYSTARPILTVNPPETTTRKMEISASPSNLDRLIAENEKLKDMNEEILSNMASLHTLMVVLFVIVIIFVLIEIFVKARFCNHISKFFNGREIENLHLLR